MLISFSPTGSVEFTRNPTLLGLFEDERKSIKRMTTIEFDDEWQCHYVVFVSGKFKGLPLQWDVRKSDDLSQVMVNHWIIFSEDHSAALVEERTQPMGSIGVYRGMVLFKTYEDAVAIEIAFVDYLREQGYSFA
jgi:hypothetical protein